jgi:hypothetical protein
MNQAPDGSVDGCGPTGEGWLGRASAYRCRDGTVLPVSDVLGVGLRSFCVNARGMQTTGESTGAWNVCVEARPHLIVNADSCRVKL